ncbi:TKL family protein kinase [Histomonas meleagridis]|uniref:TKL family protein kinase n=1 Tax=Histomonas meleagridis TaxID=135588 RepID=UPI00355A61D6|nr:TKL family protein kinase [Histomonas meleagridis]KAH0800463.1 TKL family protein kinase [Histomonas meleagridis]
MSNAFLSHTAPVIERIEQLQKLEMSTSIHCSKANSLIRTFNLLPPFLSISPPNFKVNHKFIDAMNSIVSSIDHLIQLCIQCNRESCFQFILMTSLHEVFDQFLEIRQKVIADLRSIGFDSAADLFKLSPDELLSQDQVDLKLIGIFMMQMRSRNDVVRRPDIKEKINDRLKSIQRKGVKIETDETDLGGILTVPSLPPNLNLVLEHEQLVFGDSIGSGRSGRVFKGKISGSSQVVAIKVLHCRQLSPSELEMFCREIFTLSTLNHPSILKLLGYTNQPPFCLVTELLSNGSLFQFLKSHPDELTPTDRTAIAIDVARGMSYMHQRNIIHRDLKSLNILLDDNKRARICDFGLVRLKSYAPMTGLIGTTQWMAPEILMCSTSYDVAADVYSFGIVLWELLTGEIPYKDVTTGNLPYLVVQEGLRPTIPSGTPKDLENLITSCWSQDPKKRPPFSLIVKLFNNPKYHFPGTNADALWARIGGKKRKTPSASDPLKFFDNQKRLNQYEKNNLWIPVSQVDHVLMKFTEAIRTSNYLSIDRYLTDVRALGKSGLLTSTDFIPKVIELIRSTTDNQCQLKILKMLSELLINKVLFEQFINSDGLHLLYDLMRRGNKDIAEASLIICADHIQSEIISVDLIKALLVFNGATSEGTRLLALTSLFKVIDLKFDFLCSMPTFIYHLLLFSVKPLSIKVIEFANCVYSATKDKPNMDMQVLMTLHKMLKK